MGNAIGTVHTARASISLSSPDNASGLLRHVVLPVGLGRVGRWGVNGDALSPSLGALALGVAMEVAGC